MLIGLTILVTEKHVNYNKKLSVMCISKVYTIVSD